MCLRQSASRQIRIRYNLVFAQYGLKLHYGTTANIAVTSPSANLCHFAYNVVSESHSVQYPSSGTGGSISILSFELSL